MKTRQSSDSSLTDLSSSNASVAKPYSLRQPKAYVDIPVIALINAKAYTNAKKALHVSSIPEKLPSREREFNELYSHLEMALTSNTGTCIYVSGVPGTGKTAIFFEVLRKIKSQVTSKKLPKFEFVEINGMKVTDPSQSYTLVHQALFHESVSTSQAQRTLQNYFQPSLQKKKKTIVLLDELDLLIQQKQAVLYHFLEWAQHSLIIVAIANIMDLPERQLKRKVASRLGWIRLDFQPYNEHQLLTILKERLKPWPSLFQLSALEYLARKISTIHGDARHLLMVASRALEVAKFECMTTYRQSHTNTTTSLNTEKGILALPVSIQHIQKAWDQSQELFHVLSFLPSHYKLIFIYFLHQSKQSKNSSSSYHVDSLMDWLYEQITLKHWPIELNDSILVTWLQRLHSWGWIGLNLVQNAIQLNLSLHDVHMVLKKDPEFGSWVNLLKPSHFMLDLF